MAITNFNDLVKHWGHKIDCVLHLKGKKAHSISLDCVTCDKMLIEFDCETPMEVNILDEISTRRE